MFNNEKEQLRARIKELETLYNGGFTKNEVDNLKAIQKREIENLEHKQNLKIETLKFEMENFKDKEILEKNKKIEELTNKNAVLIKENEMMNKMVDINADIVDVKDIINQLINKLPEINLKTLTVTTTGK